MPRSTGAIQLPTRAGSVLACLPCAAALRVAACLAGRAWPGVALPVSARSGFTRKNTNAKLQSDTTRERGEDDTDMAISPSRAAGRQFPSGRGSDQGQTAFGLK